MEEDKKEQKMDFSPMALPNPFTLQSFSQEKWAYMMLYDTERWFAELKGFTFDTDFMELTMAEGTALVHHYQENLLSRKGQLSGEERELLESLERRLQERLDAFESEGEAPEFFVRLSSRSPKDVGIGPEHPKILEYLEEEVNKFGGIENATPNDILRSVQTAAGRILRVKTAKEALWLIENSERTFSDLIHTLDFPAEWAMKIVIRKWRNGVDVGNEFRGFMCDGELIALSQYNDSCYYYELVGKEELIVNKIMEFWQELKPHVKYQAAIVDFVLVDNFTKVYCVELNPFGPMTGASLFDWSSERPLLQGGKDLWNDLAECKDRKRNSGEVSRFAEFFTDDPDKPVLRILHAPPPTANESFLGTLPVVKALVRQKKHERAREEEEKQKEKEKAESSRCLVM